jgi:uncharacterized membrane protein
VRYSPILLLHICAGMVGLLSGAMAIIVRKGSPRHVLAGKVFVVSMLTMAGSATYLAALKHDNANIGGGVLTAYLVTTAWLTAKRKDGETSVFDWFAMVVPLALGVLIWFSGIRMVRAGSQEGGIRVRMAFLMGTVMLLAAAGDLRMLLRGGVLGCNGSYGISGACALGCLLRQGLSSWDKETRYFLGSLANRACC